MDEAAKQALLNSPALAAPDGVTPNFDNPPNNNALAHGVIAACIAVASLCLLLRIYVQVILSRGVKIEDFLTVSAFGTYIGWMFCAYKLIIFPGYFVHQWDLKMSIMIPTGYWVHVAGVFYSVTLPFLKTAILLEWARMFVPRGTRNTFWWLCHGLIAVQLSFMIAAVLLLCLTCRPYESKWDFTIPGKCINKYAIDLSSAAVQLASDIAILFLPQKVIWGLHLSMKKKIGVSIVFSLGLLACVSAAARLAATVTYATSPDVTFRIAAVIFWASAEMTCGFVVVCVPSAPRILKEAGVIRKFKRAFGMPTTTLKSSTNNITGSALHMSKGQTSSNYRKIDEDGVPLGTLSSGKTESTEHLRDNNGRLDKAIMRTTQVTVVRDDYVDDNSTDEFDRQTAPWQGGHLGQSARGKDYNPGRR